MSKAHNKVFLTRRQQNDTDNENADAISIFFLEKTKLNKSDSFIHLKSFCSASLQILLSRFHSDLHIKTGIEQSLLIQFCSYHIHTFCVRTFVLASCEWSVIEYSHSYQPWMGKFQWTLWSQQRCFQSHLSPIPKIYHTLLLLSIY